MRVSYSRHAINAPNANRKDGPAVKYLFVVIEGCADHPLVDLEDQTPLAVAPTPRLDALAEEGRLGTVQTTPEGLDSTDDVTLPSALGYDPHEHPAGFAPIEAAGLGLFDQSSVPDHAWLFRLNLISAENGVLRDHQSGNVNAAECARLLHDLHEALRIQYPEVADDWRFIPGRGHRAILIDHGNRAYADSVMHPAFMLLDESITRYRPTGAHHKLMRDLIVTSESVFLEHEVNQMRIELGDPPITHCWPWGAGPAAARTFFRPFAERFGVSRGAMISANDFALGMARLIGWETALLNDETDFAQVVQQATTAMKSADFVCVYLTEADRLSHIGDANAKVALLSDLDQWIIGPLRTAVASYNPWRMLVMPTHATSSATGRHEPMPVPCVMAGELLGSLLRGSFTEHDAAEADLHVAIGSELMEYFLFGAGVGRPEHD